MTEVGSPSATAVAARPRRPSRGLLAVVAGLVVVLVAGVLPAAAQPADRAQPSDTDLEDRIDELEGERARLEDEARRADAGLAELERELGALRARREELTAELDAATHRVDAVTAELAELQDQQAVLDGEVRVLEGEAAEVQEQLKDRIRAIYTGRTPIQFVSLLDSTSTADLYLRQHYLQALARRDREDLARAAAIRRTLAERQRQLEAAGREVNRLVAEAEAAQRHLMDRFEEAAAVERAVAQQAERLDAEVRRLADAAEDAQREIAEAQTTLERREQERRAAEAQRRSEEAAAAQRRAQAASRSAPAPAPAPPPSPAPAPAPTAPAPTVTPTVAPTVATEPAGSPEPEPSPTATPTEDPPGESGGMPAHGATHCPQDSPRSFTDTWGAPRSGGRRHTGTDIFGLRGGMVFAITGGVIEFTRVGGNAGLWLSLRGDDGHRYWYMHLQDFVAGPGQRVAAGEHIAHNGDTGNAVGTTPHIHFEWHPAGGGAVNPYPLLREVC